MQSEIEVERSADKLTKTRFHLGNAQLVRSCLLSAQGGNTEPSISLSATTLASKHNGNDGDNNGDGDGKSKSQALGDAPPNVRHQKSIRSNASCCSWVAYYLPSTPCRIIIIYLFFFPCASNTPSPSDCSPQLRCHFFSPFLLVL